MNLHFDAGGTVLLCGCGVSIPALALAIALAWRLLRKHG